MTQTTNRMLDEFAKMMTDAAGAAQGMRREVETAMRSHAERFLGEMNVVQREEFEAVREMAVLAREENEALNRRIAALESRLGTDQAQSGPERSGDEPIKFGARKGTGIGAADDKGGDRQAPG